MVTKGLSAQRIGFLVGVAGFAITLLLPPPGEFPLAAWHALGLTWLMAVLWMTEALPLAVTALLPIVLGPLLGLADAGSVTRHYAHPLIFLFLGGFALGLAMERWRLHERLALLILSLMGGTPAREIAGFMLGTAFLSMWVSNTATAIMMLPIALSVIALRKTDGALEGNPYAVALLLAIAYGASLGGIATLIGTPPNALLAAYLADQHGIDLGFVEWMAVGVPVAAVMLAATWVWLAFVVASGKTVGTHLPASGELPGAKRSVFKLHLRELGPVSTMEKRVGMVFVLTALAWITQPLLARVLPPGVMTDTGIAIAAAIVLHALPAGDGKGSRLLDWEHTQRLPWGVLLLFGGGLALASIIQASGLAEFIASGLQTLAHWPIWVLIAAVVITVIFLTEVTSNTATTAAFLPLLGALAIAVGLPPVALAVPAAIAASCAFMLPVATPPNAIVFGSGQLQIKQMAGAGFVLNIIGVVVVTIVGTGLVAFGLIT
ncbi:MAG TPA: DASS family sodium-coupled anion symporter [Cellvibrionaceae bacterium]